MCIERKYDWLNSMSVENNLVCNEIDKYDIILRLVSREVEDFLSEK